LLRAALVSLALTLANAAAAEEMAAPRIEGAPLDWARASADAGDLAALNAASGKRFSQIEASAVPVLLPFDVAAFRKAGEPTDADKFVLGGFTATKFFQSGPAGYDAVFTLRAPETSEFSDIAYSEPVYILVSGLRFTYTLDGALPEAAPVKDLEAAYPGIRRVWHEFVQRTVLERYGATYVVAIHCRDIAPTGRILSCAQAARIADKFVRSLRLTGGMPPAEPVASVSLQRPQARSPDFTYHPPGSLIPQTGRRPELGGRTDRTVYANLRFPLAGAPAFANSQSFNNWGDCDFTGRSPHPMHSKDAPYTCKVNGRPLVFNEAAGPNYRYPWRDNFCEHRRFPVGQCPGGEGHQGQDIRPSFCKTFNEGADRCLAYQHDAVAADDGMILRWRKKEALLLFVNTPSAHLRLRYLHMHPRKLDESGMTTGRRVERGDVLGQIGNYDQRDHGTTYHLHFDMQVPTAIGYVFVNPYVTLVASYEQLLGALGTELARVAEEPPVQQAAALVPEATSSIPAPPLQTVSLPLPAARPKPVAPPLPTARPRIRPAPLPLARPRHGRLARG
jgi:hypothetical protein